MCEIVRVGERLYVFVEVRGRNSVCDRSRMCMRLLERVHVRESGV